ncbi:hypothetical protein MMC07_005647 [Pseudocyphellaria aurata]|nr:hypothetical protein [Pseudocyphellaria aurata]
MRTSTVSPSMLQLTRISLLLPLFSSLNPVVASAPPSYTTTIHHFPPSSPTPIPLATLSFSPLDQSLSKLLAFTPPSAPAANSTELIRIAVVLPSSDPSAAPRYRTTSTSLASFHPSYKGRLRLVVSRNGDVLGASWRAGLATTVEGQKVLTANEKEGNVKGDFDLLVEKEGPKPFFEKFPAKGASGNRVVVGEDGEEVEEKTLLQKYWWILVGVAFLAITSGGGDK